MEAWINKLAIPVLLIIITAIVGSWTSNNTRIRELEVRVATLEIKINNNERSIEETHIDIKEIKQLLHEIDKKVDINEQKHY
jgi:uncharacterized coiled-coil protein SlyX